MVLVLLLVVAVEDLWVSVHYLLAELLNYGQLAVPAMVALLVGLFIIH